MIVGNFAKSIGVAACLIAVTHAVKAETTPFLQELKTQGATVTAGAVLGGLQSYEIVPKNGKPYWVFVAEDGTAIMGLPFDSSGNALPMDLSMTAKERAKNIALQTSKQPRETTATPPSRSAREQIDALDNVSFVNLTDNLTSFTVGNQGPLITVFMEPRCPWCKRYYTLLKQAADRGEVQFRVVPVDTFKGRAVTSLAVLEAPAGQRQAVWESAVFEGNAPDENAKFPQRIEEESVIANETFRRWHPTRGVPFSLFRSKNGEIRQFTGFPKLAEFQALLSEAAQ